MFNMNILPILSETNNNPLNSMYVGLVWIPLAKRTIRKYIFMLVLLLKILNHPHSFFFHIICVLQTYIPASGPRSPPAAASAM